ncbi:signal peptide peptidase SppA [Prochlorothrix hollandica]|uniref:signal peptide peptidase SppA n=1 Tax=Prochlorothrix hollandica TaxID=1223 RepID=UPI00333FC59F
MIWPFQRRKRKIARIVVEGAIDGGTRKHMLKALKDIEEQKFPALLLRINSPGGTVGDSQEIHAALKRLQDKIKIVVSFGNISASGGVYIAMAAPHVMANPGTITGSIGVILRGNNLAGLLDKVGVSFKVIKSGPYKDILAFDRPMTDPERDILQALIDSSYNQFVQAVATGRNLREEVVRSFADGRVFTGEQALELGLVDRLGMEEDARRWAAELANLDPDKAETVTFAPSKPVVSRFLSSQISGFTALSTGLETLEFELSTAGQPLWLYQP